MLPLPMVKASMLFPMITYKKTPQLCPTYVGPSWLKNLYFAYMLVLRAIIKTESYWSTHQFYTGNDAKDASVHEQVMLMIQAARYVHVC